MSYKWVDEESPMTDWFHLFCESDIVSIHLPENASTHKIVSKYYLNLMKKTAFLVNTSRGSVLDEQELAWMLRNNRLKGAALDVTDTLTEEEIKETPSLLVTPHIAGSTLQDRIRTDEFIVERVISQLQSLTNPPL